ncbi:Metal transporter CNNM1 [Bienertia sinuspersici]
MWGRLQTRDRLRRIGLQVEQECPMCGMHSESADHLFTQCIYVRNCIKELNRNHHLIPLCSNMGRMNDWLQKPTVGRFRCQTIQCICTALLYNIWIQRNSAIWQGSLSHFTKVVQQIKNEVWLRIQSIMPRKVQNKDKDWLRSILL